MRSFFENKIAFAATSLLFALAFAWNLSQGSQAGYHLLLPTESVTTAHGPLVPPDPWTGSGSVTVAHGPLVPPDPWTGSGSVTVAHGPLVPPDPWTGSGSVTVAHGPLVPPDPWTGSGTFRA